MRNPFRRPQPLGKVERAEDGTFIDPRQRRAWALHATEKRAITEVPWDVGDSRFGSALLNPETAIRFGAIYGAARLLATSVSVLPLHTYRKIEGVRTLLPNPPLFTKPSIHGTLRDWLFRLMASLVLWGNAYGLITARDGLGYPLMVEWLHPKDVKVEDQGLSGRGSFTNPIWRWRGAEISAEDLIHIPWFTIPFRIKGLSPIEAWSAPVRSALAAHDYIGDWFAAGGIPPGKFKNSNRIVPPEESTKIRTILTAAIRSHEPLVYGKDWDFDPFMIPPRDAMFIDLLKVSATEIAAIYGIPPEKIGGQTAGNLTYQTVELQTIDYLTFTLLGWITMLEAAFFELLPRPRYVKFNVDSLIRPDLKTRHEVYEIDRRIGLRNTDELRELEEMAPLPAGQGKSYVPLAVIESTASLKPPVEGPPIPAPTPPNTPPDEGEDQQSAPSNNGRRQIRLELGPEGELLLAEY